MRSAQAFDIAALLAAGVSAMTLSRGIAAFLSSGRGRPAAAFDGLGRWLLAALPPAAAVHVARRLTQADLEGRWSVEGWMGGNLAAVSAAAAGAVLLLAGGQRTAAGILAALGGVLVFAAALFVRRRRQHCERHILKELPAYLDAMTVCVEAGATLHMALRIAVDKAPPSPARRVFERLLREIRMGRSRVEALNLVSELYDIEAVRTLFAALVQSEGHGMSLGSVLRAQSLQRATERQLRAEKAAMKAPVKMLGPLVLCIFPCTFIVIAVPVLVRMFLEVR